MGMAPTSFAGLVVIPLDELTSLLRRELAVARAEQATEKAPALLDRNGIARALGVGISMIDRFRREGCPVIWIGDSPRFELEPCLAWLRQRSAGGGSK